MATPLPPSSTDNPGVPTQYRKPKADLYTLMLVIALVAILVGILFLVFENQGDYDWKMKDTVISSTIVQGWRIGPWLAGFLG